MVLLEASYVQTACFSWLNSTSVAGRGCPELYEVFLFDSVGYVHARLSAIFHDESWAVRICVGVHVDPEDCMWHVLGYSLRITHNKIHAKSSAQALC